MLAGHAGMHCAQPLYCAARSCANDVRTLRQTRMADLLAGRMAEVEAVLAEVRAVSRRLVRHCHGRSLPYACARRWQQHVLVLNGAAIAGSQRRYFHWPAAEGRRCHACTHCWRSSTGACGCRRRAHVPRALTRTWAARVVCCRPAARVAGARVPPSRGSSSIAAHSRDAALWPPRLPPRPPPPRRLEHWVELRRLRCPTAHEARQALLPHGQRCSLHWLLLLRGTLLPCDRLPTCRHPLGPVPPRWC